MKVLGFLPDPGGCGFYRMRQPLEWMKYAGHEVRYFLHRDLLSITRERTALLRWADAVLCQRLTSVDLMEILRDYCPDAVIAFDLDDFYWNLPYENQARITINEAKLKELARSMMKADVVIASTPYLRDLLTRFHPRVELVRNAMDPTWMRRERPENPCLRIGWAGSVTHRVDLEPMLDGLDMALGKMPEAAAVFMGIDAGSIARQFCHADQTYFHDPVIIDHYMPVLGRLNLDIGLAPIREHEFNRAKSEVKWLEYSATGAAVIASDVGPYREAIENGKTGLLVPHADPYKWRDAILELAFDKEKREAMARAAQEVAMKRNGAAEWSAKLAEILASRESAPTRTPTPPRKDSVTVAILNWVPQTGPRFDTMVECLPRILARCEELTKIAQVTVVIRCQGSCAAAGLWIKDEIKYWLGRGLKVVLEVATQNGGIKVLNEIRREHPADYLLKIDNDVLIPPGGLVSLLETWVEVDKQFDLGMLGLDVAWMNGETFATREKGKCVADQILATQGEVFLMKSGSVVIGQCRLEQMSRLADVGGYPERMYGTDQPNADAYSKAKLVNAHFLPFELGPEDEVRPRPLIHRGVEETEGTSEFKRTELRKAVGIK